MTAPVRDERRAAGGHTVAMIEIELDGRPLWYYPDGESVPPEVTERVFGYSFRHDSLTMHHPRTRQVVIPWPGLGDLGMFVLHWDDDTDLELLDHLAAEGADITDAVMRAVVCEVHEPMCRNCDNRSVVLVPAVVAPGRTIAKTSAHAGSTVCPNCGDPGYVHHVEVLA